MKNKSVIALMLAFTMCFTSVCPALAAENTAVESEEVNESNPEEVSEENAAPAEETASVTQEAAEADEEMNDASSDKQEEPVEVEEAADVTEQNTGVTADAAEENEDIYDEAADAAVAEAATEEFSKKAGEAASEPEFAPVSGNEEGQTVVPGNSGDDSPEDLFEKYMSVEFGLSDNSSMRKSKKITGTRLEGNDLAVYQKVAKELPAIAEGERASTVFELTPEVFGYEKTEWTAEELGVASIYEADGTVSKQASAAALAKTAYDLDKVTTALLADFPFELYWFDKTAGCSAPYSWYTNFVDGEYVYGITNISIRFSVAGEFSGSDAYTVKTDIGQSLQDAVNNVNTIIEQYSGASDEDKLLSYKEEICERVSYNDDAAAGNFDFNYGNPWQLLWVFDNDVETKVVCEGYSKAFKYLCDQSSFDSNITCILVTGTMAGGTGAGGHMWNIVKLGDGLNYLADVTNCDDGSVGSPDKLFLVRTEDLDANGEIETGYTFHFDGSSVAYSYDENTLNYYNQNEISLGELQHVHDLIKTDAKDATCTEAGNIEYWTCIECEKLFSDEEGTTEITAADTVVPAKGHSLEKTEAKAATCTEAGNTEYWTCSECKKLFGDDQGTTEITEADTVVAAKGHSLEKTEAKAATCTEAGNIEYWTCSKCKKLYKDSEGTQEITEADTVVAAKGHSLEKTEAKAATCTEAGNTEYWTCSECKKLFGDDQGTTEITEADTVVAAKGHSLEKTEAKDATCTEAGNTEYWTCSECKKLFGDDQGTTEITEADTVVAATGHDWGEWTVVKEATEEEEGLERRTCSNDESHTEEKTIPKLNHVHSLEKTDAKAATCTEAGNIEYWTCSKCKKLYKDSAGTQEITAADTVVAAKGHSLEKTEAKAATCTEAGNTEYWTCSECKKLFGDDQGTTEITAEDTVVAAKGHSLEKTEAKDATCTETGNTEYWTCSECKKLFSDAEGTTEITEADTVVAAKGHSLEKTEAKDATCTEAGNTEYWTCSECKKLFGDDQGTTEITAADTVVAATGHDWGEWTVVTKATEEKEGLETRTCLNDESHKEERTIPKLQGLWKKNSNGWWYDRGDGSYPAGTFETIKGTTYYFNESGYMLTGWQKISGEWYYFSAGGAMLTDWQKINGKWYYFNAEGAMQTGWQNINGTWYYFGAGGAMQTGWQNINGTWYYFSAGGAMQTGWQNIGGKWYYFSAGGAMQTGWQNINGKWYYFNTGGAMQTGWQNIGGKWYYFSTSGVMTTGWQNINGTWYYMEESGAMATNKWVGNYYLTGSGAMARNTWIGNYYVGADGKWIPGYGTSTSTSGSSSSGSSGIVYWVPGGSVYHSTDRCPALGRSDPSTIRHGTIAESGKSRPCKDCIKRRER